MPEPLAVGLSRVRELLLDAEHLVRGVGAGRPRRSPRAQEDPAPADRVEVRVVDLKTGPHLHVVWRTGPRVETRNVPTGDAAAMAEVVDGLLGIPLGTWHVETTDRTVQLRVTKRGEAQVHAAATSRRDVVSRSHDRAKQRLIDPDDPLFDVLGAGADADKRRQVDAFLRLLDPVVSKMFDADRPLRVVDLGCGNAYLTMAAHRFLSQRRPGTVTVGVEQRADLVDRSTSRAESAGLEGLRFTAGTIEAADTGLDGVDVVLALHACDTATDAALAQAVRWGAPVILAAPCCHHDIQRQLAGGPDRPPGPPGPSAYHPITRHPILRERFADVLTDALRAGILRDLGYRVDVVEFVDSRHTPRNAMIRARLTGRQAPASGPADHEVLAAQWGVVPALTRMLDPIPRRNQP